VVVGTDTGTAPIVQLAPALAVSLASEIKKRTTQHKPTAPMSGNCAHLAVAHRMEVMAGWATLHNQQSSSGPSVGDTARPGASSGKEKGRQVAGPRRL
jgi:hypothetical protein